MRTLRLLERLLYRVLRVAGDARAVSRGTFGKRLARRQAYRVFGRALRRLL